MTQEQAWEILVSYCVGRRHGANRFHTADLAAALSWALNELTQAAGRKQNVDAPPPSR